MVYKPRRHYRRGRKAYRRNPGRYHRKAASTAMRALSIAKHVQSLVNVEYKFKNGGDTTDASTTPNIFLLNGVAEGLTELSRNGNSIRPKSLAINAHFFRGITATFDLVRFMVVRDKDSAGTAPTITEILATSAPLSHRNLGTDQNRFDILHDDLLLLSGTSAAGEQTTHTSKLVRIDMSLNKLMKYDGGGATDVSWGALYAVVLGTVAAGTSATDTSINWQMTFIDN